MTLISRYPREHHRALTDFVSEFDTAADLIHSNPSLAVCLAHAATWDTLRAGGPCVGELLTLKRRQICEALGFPGTESVVRILSKIAPKACNIALLMRMRRRFGNPHLVKILSHIKRIGDAEMRLIANWEPTPHVSLRIFLELAAKPKPEFFRLLTDTELMMEQSERSFPPLRSVMDVWRLHGRLVETARKGSGRKPFSSSPDSRNRNHPTHLEFKRTPGGRPTQNNCVSSYAEDVMLCLAYIYRVLEPERATVSIVPSDDGWELGEIAGAHNSPVSDETIAQVEKWLSNGQFPPPPVRGTATIQPLSCRREIQEEGRKMNNCRIICEWDVVMGRTYFYKVLEPERATLSISRDKEIWKLGDVAGPNNIPVSDETRSEVERWVRDGQFPIPPLRGTDVIQPLSSPGESRGRGAKDGQLCDCPRLGCCTRLASFLPGAGTRTGDSFNPLR